jgi:hypothetical protein
VARNGSGVYTIPASSDYPAIGGTVISPTDHNATYADIQTALTNSLASNGETTVTGNLPLSGFKLTGLGAGTTNGDSVRYEQVQLIDATLTALAALSTSADTYIRATGTDTFTMSAVTANAQLLLADSAVPRLTISNTWLSTQTFSYSGATIFNQGAAAAQLQLNLTGTPRGLIGADATYSTLLQTTGGTTTVRVTNSNGLFETIFAAQFGADAYFSANTAPSSTLSLGFRGIPAGNTSSVSATISAGTNAGTEFTFTGSTAAQTLTIDPTFPDRQVIRIRNDSTVSVTIAPGAGYTMRLDGGTTTGNRTLAAGGTANVYKRNSNSDMIVGGAGVT